MRRSLLAAQHSGANNAFEDPSAFGAAEHERQAALTEHQALLEKLRQEEDPADTTEKPSEKTPEDTRHEERVEPRTRPCPFRVNDDDDDD